jgi:hypothetical protein
MGDPRFITSESAFHVGTCTQNGLFPRPNGELLTQYAGVIQSYCDTGKLLFIFVDVFFSG